MKFASEESNINSKKENKIYDKKLTNCLEYYIQWFNKLTFFIPTEILKHKQKKLRIKLINYFIDSAYFCFQIKNFNSMIAIISKFIFFYLFIYFTFIKINLRWFKYATN